MKRSLPLSPTPGQHPPHNDPLLLEPHHATAQLDAEGEERIEALRNTEAIFPMDSKLRILDEVLTDEGRHIINDAHDTRNDIFFARLVAHKIELLKKDAQKEMLAQTTFAMMEAWKNESERYMCDIGDVIERAIGLAGSMMEATWAQRGGQGRAYQAALQVGREDRGSG